MAQLCMCWGKEAEVLAKIKLMNTVENGANREVGRLTNFHALASIPGGEGLWKERVLN